MAHFKIRYAVEEIAYTRDWINVGFEADISVEEAFKRLKRRVTSKRSPEQTFLEITLIEPAQVSPASAEEKTEQ